MERLFHSAMGAADAVLGLSVKAEELGFGHMAARALLMYLMLIGVVRVAINLEGAPRPPAGFGDPTCPHVERDDGVCVRCGHCAWSCEQLHGVSRLVRRGDKVVTQLAGSGAATLLLPNTCQQCSHAACMIDCPTGAVKVNIPYLLR